MQLSGTIFGICVLPVRPQLEKVLNLTPDCLKKEVALTQVVFIFGCFWMFSGYFCKFFGYFGRFLDFWIFLTILDIFKYSQFELQLFLNQFFVLSFFMEFIF
jgi:hypothetical protein